jgi:ABC-type amino acid transport system permease subunit
MLICLKQALLTVALSPGMHNITCFVYVMPACLPVVLPACLSQVVSYLKQHHLEVHTRTGKPYK